MRTTCPTGAFRTRRENTRGKRKWPEETGSVQKAVDKERKTDEFQPGAGRIDREKARRAARGDRGEGAGVVG